MDGRRGQPDQWRSSIPGVSQRDGAPASLGLVAWGAAAGAFTQARDGEGAGVGVGVRDDGARARVGLAGVGRRRGGRRWRALALAGLALIAVLGVARVAGADAGQPDAAAGAGWELAGDAGTADPLGDGNLGSVGAPEGSGRAGSEPADTPSATVATSAPTGPAGSAETAETAAPAGPAGDVLSADLPDWWAVLAELDLRRARALTALDPELLADYAEPGSALWSADAALVADLRERGLHPQGLTSRVLAVERSESQGGRARVQVVDRRSAYDLVDAQGSVVESVPEASLTRWSVTLIRDALGDTGWRVVDVTPSAGSGGSGDGAEEGAP